MDLRQILTILLARRRLILAVFFGVALAGGLAAWLLPKRYTAEVMLVIDAKAANNILGALLPPQMMSGYMSTQVDVITSRRVTEGAAARPEVAGDPGLQADWREATAGRDAPLPFATWFGSELQRDLEVTPERDSSMVTVSYTCPDPERCARVANAVAQAYIDTNLMMKVAPARQTADWFDERTRQVREALETAQRKLSDYQRRNGILATDERVDVETARLDELSRQLVTAQAEKSASGSKRSESGSGEEMQEVVQNPLIAGLKSEVARREAERDQMAARYGANYPDMLRIRNEIASLQRRIGAETARIVGSVVTTDRANAARVDEIAAAVSAQKAQVMRLKSLRDEASVLQKDVESAQKAYDLVTGRLVETSLESQARETNVFVLVPATAPLKASWPRGPLMLALSTVLGLVLGLALALTLEMARRRVRSAFDVVEALDVPVLGIVPRARRVPASPPPPLLPRPGR